MVPDSNYMRIDGLMKLILTEILTLLPESRRDTLKDARLHALTQQALPSEGGEHRLPKSR